MKLTKKLITITHRQTGELIAKGYQGWGFFPFEGNYYIRPKYIKTNGFKFSLLLGICFYKFVYLWLHLKLNNGKREDFMAWMYVIPNPLLPFIWFRIALPQNHHALEYSVSY
jgi:uncharacterized protein (DUF427 family)